MSSKYAKPLQVPVEFPDVLRNFAREVLRLQGKLETKDAIYEFGVQYFQDLIQKRSGAHRKSTSAAGPPGFVQRYMKMSEDELKDVLVQTFQEADPDNSGQSVYEDFKQILNHAGDQLQFSASELKALYAEADENDQGYISYEDFIPLAIQAAIRLRVTAPQRHARIDQFANRVTEVFLHGMMQDEIESLLREIFQRADPEETGTMGRLDFMDCLRDADLGLSRREVNILMSEAPLVDNEGGNIIAYQDFIPICFPMLKDAFIQEIIDLPNDQDALTQYLVEVFASGDTESTGLLTVGDLTRHLRAADIGLTRLQITAVMAEAQEDKSGFIHYEKFAAHVAGMVLVLTSFDSQQTFAAYLQNYRKTSEYYTVLDMNQHTFEQTLSRALEALDENHRGLLPREEVIEAIRNAFPDISQRQMRSLMALVDVDDMGEVEYNLINHSAFQALQKLQEYDMMIMES